MAKSEYGRGRHPNSKAALERSRKSGAAAAGNGRAVQHRLGTTLEANLPPDVEAIHEALKASAPVRAADGGLPIYDEAAIELLARQLAKIRYGYEWLEEHGWFDEGELRPLVSELAKFERQLMEGLDRMGMTAAGRARLGLDLARTTDLATAMSEPNPERRRDLLADLDLDS